jgi:hypothetical protein
MELPPKALYALIDIKKELLSRVAVEKVQAPPEKSREKAAAPVTFRQRHARSSGAYQRGCQGHKFWTPVH